MSLSVISNVICLIEMLLEMTNYFADIFGTRQFSKFQFVIRPVKYLFEVSKFFLTNQILIQIVIDPFFDLSNVVYCLTVFIREK